MPIVGRRHKKPKLFKPYKPKTLTLEQRREAYRKATLEAMKKLEKDEKRIAELDAKKVNEQVEGLEKSIKKIDLMIETTKKSKPSLNAINRFLGRVFNPKYFFSMAESPILHPFGTVRDFASIFFSKPKSWRIRELKKIRRMQEELLEEAKRIRDRLRDYGE